MKWWIKAMQPGKAAAVIVATLLVCAVVGTGAFVSVPSLSSQGFARVPLLSLVALGPTSVVLGVWAALPAPLAAAAVRRTVAYSALVLMAVLSASAIPILWAPDTAYLLVRSVAGLCGVGAVSWALFGRGAATVAPTVYLIAACVFGIPGAGNRPSLWAWPLRDPLDTAAWIVAGGLAGAGLFALSRAPSTDLRRGNES
jgi:hypothetical protein